MIRNTLIYTSCRIGSGTCISHCSYDLTLISWIRYELWFSKMKQGVIVCNFDIVFANEVLEAECRIKQERSPCVGQGLTVQINIMKASRFHFLIGEALA